jgi:glycosyltransferase involved in cell wall biosynthesis
MSVERGHGDRRQATTINTVCPMNADAAQRASEHVRSGDAPTSSRGVPEAGDHTLRVLMVMHLPASLELGGARVQLELAEVLRGHGCKVEVLDRDAILGGRRRGRLGVSPDAFAAAATRHVRSIAADFDVIDAHQGNLPVSKRRLAFNGLLVARSVGLAQLYADFVRESQSRWPTTTNVRLPARPVRRWRKRRFLRHVTETFRLSDLIVVPNEDEREYLARELQAGEKTVVLPLGLSEARLQDLGRLLGERTSTKPRVAFIGDWNARKGSHDWPDILARVRAGLPGASFAFLGTHAGREEVGRALGVEDDDPAVDVVPSYSAPEVGELLRDVRAGALPSYVEGLGLGVLEKMAAGIPSVCYDVPGPRETIGRVDPTLLVAAGDTAAFATRLLELMTLEEPAYRQLSARCRAVAETFSWRLIGERTLAAYQQGRRLLAGPS